MPLFYLKSHPDSLAPTLQRGLGDIWTKINLPIAIKILLWISEFKLLDIAIKYLSFKSAGTTLMEQWQQFCSKKSLCLTWGQDNTQCKQLIKDLPLYWDLRCRLISNFKSKYKSDIHKWKNISLLSSSTSNWNYNHNGHNYFKSPLKNIHKESGKSSEVQNLSLT